MDEITQNSVLWPVAKIEKECICLVESKRKIILIFGSGIFEAVLAKQQYIDFSSLSPFLISKPILISSIQIADLKSSPLYLQLHNVTVA
jgi:hypothetical protein